MSRLNVFLGLHGYLKHKSSEFSWTRLMISLFFVARNSYGSCLPKNEGTLEFKAFLPDVCGLQTLSKLEPNFWAKIAHFIVSLRVLHSTRKNKRKVFNFLNETSFFDQLVKHDFLVVCFK